MSYVARGPMRSLRIDAKAGARGGRRAGHPALLGPSKEAEAS